MATGQTVENDIRFTIPLRILKVDKEKREIEGIATQELKDVHGEVVDHESMKAVLKDWPGNIREMHQAIAVGKVIKVVSDDQQKATILRVRVSKGAPDTWEKVIDGTLSMFSIGGTGKRVTTKDASGNEEKRIFMTALHETSLVDNGACPTAKFDIVKTVDGQAIECQPEEPAEQPAVPPVEQKTKGRPDRRRSRPVCSRSLPAKAHQGDHRRRRQSPSLPQIAAAPALIEKRIESYDIDCALSAISMLERLMASEWYDVQDAEFHGTDNAVGRAQLEILKTAIQLVLSFLVSEFAAQFDEPQPADDASAVANVRRAAIVADVLKKGARHSKADIQMIQTMHDSSVTLGALCQKDEGDVEAAKAAAAAAAAVPALTSEAVQTMISDAVSKALDGQQATHDKAIADLTEQVQKLANEPLPGGPKSRALPEGATAVEKTIGAPVPVSDLNPAKVNAFATELVKSAKTEQERENIAATLLKFQHATGTGMARMKPTAPATAAEETPATT
jgi:hypothetical protein